MRMSRGSCRNRYSDRKYGQSWQSPAENEVVEAMPDCTLFCMHCKKKTSPPDILNNYMNELKIFSKLQGSSRCKLCDAYNLWRRGTPSISRQRPVKKAGRLRSSRAARQPV